MVILPNSVLSIVIFFFPHFGALHFMRSRRGWNLGEGVHLAMKFQPDRQAPGAPGAWTRFKHASTGLSAMSASSIARQRPRSNVVPIASDQALAAAMAVSALPGLVMHIARVDIAKPVFQSDPSRSLKRSRRRWRRVSHSPVGVEGGKMQRRVRSQPLPDPLAQ